MRSVAQRASHLLSRLESLLDRERRVWLRSMIHRQDSQPWKEIQCGTPPERLSRRVARFRREWTGVLREIASACPLVADSCEALLQLDPLSPESGSAVERHAAQIRRVLSDPSLARSLYRERDREAFGGHVKARRKALGWSLRRLAREAADAAKRIGFGLRAPDRYQLMDYEAGRSDAHASTKVVIAAALAISVDELQARGGTFPKLLPVAFEVQSYQRLRENVRGVRPYQIGVYAIENPDAWIDRIRRSRTAA